MRYNELITCCAAWRSASDDKTARIWNIPARDFGNSERLRLSVEVKTRKWLDDNGDVQTLTDSELQSHREQLDKIGGQLDALN